MSEPIGKVTINMGGHSITVLTIREDPGRWVIEAEQRDVTGYLVPWPTGGDDAKSDKGTSGRDAASD